MSEETECVPYEVAKQIVGNVIEEEHLHEANRRILTVYDKQGKELCWYDAEDVLSEVRQTGLKGDELKIAAVEHILHQIPVWAVKDAAKRYMEEKGK